MRHGDVSLADDHRRSRDRRPARPQDVRSHCVGTLRWFIAARMQLFCTYRSRWFGGMSIYRLSSGLLSVLCGLQELEEQGEDTSKYDVFMPTVVRPRKPDIVTTSETLNSAEVRGCRYSRALSLWRNERKIFRGRSALSYTHTWQSISVRPTPCLFSVDVLLSEVCS